MTDSTPPRPVAPRAREEGLLRRELTPPRYQPATCRCGLPPASAHAFGVIDTLTREHAVFADYGAIDVVRIANQLGPDGGRIRESFVWHAVETQPVPQAA